MTAKADPTLRDVLEAGADANDTEVTGLADPTDDSSADTKGARDAAIADALAAVGATFDYNQLDDPGAVGAGKTWFQPADPESIGTIPRGGGLFVRKPSDDGWISVGFINTSDATWDTQAIADATSVVMLVASKISDLDKIFFSVSAANGLEVFTASAFRPDSGLKFFDGLLKLGGDAGPSLSMGGDPTAAPTAQEFVISPQGTWTGGSFDLADAFSPAAAIGTIAWDAEAADVETLLNDWWGDPVFAVVGGPFPDTPMTVTFDAGDGSNIYPATKANSLAGTDPAVGYTRTQNATSAITAADGSIHLDSDGKWWCRTSGAWVDTGMLASSSFGRGLFALADAAALRTAAGLGTSATHPASDFDAAGAAAAAVAAEATARDAAIATAIAALINGAPGALDTLKELADAINDDASFAASVTTALAGKQPLDADLTSIAALDSSTAGAIASDGAGWIKKTYAQFKTALSLVASDVGLGNVTNDAQVKASQLDTDGTFAANSDTKVASQKATKTYVDAEASARSTADGLLVAKSLYDANTILKADTDDTPAALTMGASTILARLASGGIVAATPAQLRTLLSLVVGTDVQAHDADLDTYAGITPTAIAQSILAAANAAAVKTLLSLVAADVGLGNVTNNAQLKIASNLSDVASAATALANLGGATLVKRGRRKASGGTVYNGIPGGYCQSVTTAVAGANAIGYEPFIVDEEGITLVQFECEVTAAGAAGKLLRLGIYAADSDWQPGALLYDSGTIAADSLGRKVATPGGGGLVLPAGRYLGARQTDGTPTMRAITGELPGMGMGNLGASPFIGAYFKSVTFAAYTDPGTKWDSVTSTSVPMGRWLLFQWTPS